LQYSGDPTGTKNERRETNKATIHSTHLLESILK